MRMHFALCAGIIKFEMKFRWNHSNCSIISHRCLNKRFVFSFERSLRNDRRTKKLLFLADAVMGCYLIILSHAQREDAFRVCVGTLYGCPDWDRRRASQCTHAQQSNQPTDANAVCVFVERGHGSIELAIDVRRVSKMAKGVRCVRCDNDARRVERQRLVIENFEPNSIFLFKSSFILHFVSERCGGNQWNFTRQSWRKIEKKW